MAFGPESTNPRERRAYAHLLILRALETGKPEDKKRSLEFALEAGHTVKGNALPKVALRTIVNAYLNEGVIRTVSSPKDSWQETVKPSWLFPEFVETYELAGKVLGGMSGVEIHKPNTPEEYAKAAASMVNPNEASYGQYNHCSVVNYDFSVPGTAHLADVAQAIRIPRILPPVKTI